MCNDTRPMAGVKVVIPAAEWPNNEQVSSLSYGGVWAYQQHHDRRNAIMLEKRRAAEKRLQRTMRNWPLSECGQPMLITWSQPTACESRAWLQCPEHFSQKAASIKFEELVVDAPKLVTKTEGGRTFTSLEGAPMVTAGFDLADGPSSTGVIHAKLNPDGSWAVNPPGVEQVKYHHVIPGPALTAAKGLNKDSDPVGGPLYIYSDEAVKKLEEHSVALSALKRDLLMNPPYVPGVIKPLSPADLKPGAITEAPPKGTLTNSSPIEPKPEVEWEHDSFVVLREPGDDYDSPTHVIKG